MMKYIFIIGICFQFMVSIAQIPTYLSDTIDIAPGNEWSNKLILHDSSLYFSVLGVCDYIGFESCIYIQKYSIINKNKENYYYKRNNPHISTLVWKDTSLYFTEFSYKTPAPHPIFIKKVDSDVILKDSVLFPGTPYYSYLHSRNMFFDQDTLYLLFREPIDSLGNAVMRVSKMLYPDSMIWEQRHIVGRTVYPYSFQMSMDTAILVSAFYWEGVYAMANGSQTGPINRRYFMD